MFTNDGKTFFASINSTSGFHSNFPAIFDPRKLNKIFILKGGPGTGKSTFMKTISKEALSRGFSVEHFICSSDPKSLDGIIINEIKVAVLDGTSPHLTDPNFPGVVENIINLGSFWNSDRLCENKSNIISLIKEKKRYFQRAYQFLSAYGEISTEFTEIVKEALDQEKMNLNIKRQCAKFFQKEGEHSVLRRNIATFSKYGFTELDSFQTLSKDIWIVEDHLFSGKLYLQALFDFANQCGQKIYISTSPENISFPNALFFPDCECCFVLGERNYDQEMQGKKYHYINMKRFLDFEFLSEHKQKIRFGQKCMKMLFCGALESLADAGSCHEELEHYYIEATDFMKLEVTVKETIKTIFGH